MAKRCPECGARFAETANVCDQHGVALVAIPERFSPRRAAWVAALALAALTPSLVRLGVAEAFEVTPGGGYLERMEGAERGAKSREDWLADKVLRVPYTVRRADWVPEAVVPGGFGLWLAGQEGTAGGGQEWRVPLTDPVLRGVLARPPAEGVACEIRGVVVVRLAGREWAVAYRRRLVLHPHLAF